MLVALPLQFALLGANRSDDDADGDDAEPNAPKIDRANTSEIKSVKPPIAPDCPSITAVPNEAIEIA